MRRLTTGSSGARYRAPLSRAFAARRHTVSLGAQIDEFGHGELMCRLASLVAVIILAAAASCLEAQPAATTYRMGFLAYQPCPTVLDPKGSFMPALRELGYVEGRNLIVHCRDAIGRFDRLPSLAAELRGLNVDVLVTEGTPQSLAAKAATASIPIVMVGVGDPVGSGLVRSLARPGANLTGSAMFPTVDVVVKGLDLLKQIAPRVSRIGVVWDPKNLALVSVDGQLDVAAKSLLLQIQRIGVRTDADVPHALATAVEQRLDALLVHPLPVGPAGVERITGFALGRQLPVITWAEVLAPIPGVLFSYGPQYSNVYGNAALLVDKILKGAHPSDLPVEQPSKFSLVINQKTVRTLGLKIPPSLLLQADRFIE